LQQKTQRALRRDSGTKISLGSHKPSKMKIEIEKRAYEKFAPASTDFAFFRPSTSLVRASLRAP